MEQSVRTAPPEDWTVPPVSVALSHAGGIDGVLERVDTFPEYGFSQRTLAPGSPSVALKLAPRLHQRAQSGLHLLERGDPLELRGHAT